MQTSAQPQPEHVTATATFLGLVSARGLSASWLACTGLQHKLQCMSDLTTRSPAAYASS